MIRVFIVGDSAASRTSVAQLLSGDTRFEVVGGAAALQTSASSYRETHADVLIVDYAGTAGSISGTRFPESPATVLLADDWTRPEIRAALRNGARAVLRRDSSAEQLCAAVEAAAAGLMVLGPEEADVFLPQSTGAFDAGDALLEPLTAREIEVLGLMAEGAGNKTIAARLGVSEHTVKFHVSSLLGKLGAAGRTEAVARAIQRGLVVM